PVAVLVGLGRGEAQAEHLGASGQGRLGPKATGLLLKQRQQGPLHRLMLTGPRVPRAIRGGAELEWQDEPLHELAPRHGATDARERRGPRERPQRERERRVPVEGRELAERIRPETHHSAASSSPSPKSSSMSPLPPPNGRSCCFSRSVMARSE